MAHRSDRRGHHIKAAAVAASCALLVSGCHGGSGQSAGGHTAATMPPTSSPSASHGCSLSAKLVPSCGALWGISTHPATVQQEQKIERMVGRKFDIIYHYHDIGNVVPSVTERRQLAAGHILHIAIASRRYIQSGRAPANEPSVTWANVAAGDFDAGLSRQAKGVAALHVPVFVTFEQEANQRKKLDVRGDAVQFIAAWRHVHEVFQREGATNAVWVWVMTGNGKNLTRAGELWPGNTYVDWISWNVYNGAGCSSGSIDASSYTSFLSAFLPFYRWVHKYGAKIGMDPHKPMMISEAGSILYPNNPQKTAAWYASIPSVIAKYPQVKAVQLWDSETSAACDFEFQRNAAVLRSVTQDGHQPELSAYNGRPLQRVS